MTSPGKRMVRIGFGWINSDRIVRIDNLFRMEFGSDRNGSNSDVVRIENFHVISDWINFGLDHFGFILVRI